MVMSPPWYDWKRIKCANAAVPTVFGPAAPRVCTRSHRNDGTKSNVTLPITRTQFWRKVRRGKPCANADRYASANQGAGGAAEVDSMLHTSRPVGTLMQVPPLLAQAGRRND
jgi:hypothetical protein